MRYYRCIKNVVEKVSDFTFLRTINSLIDYNINDVIIIENDEIIKIKYNSDLFGLSFADNKDETFFNFFEIMNESQIRDYKLNKIL